MPARRASTRGAGQRRFRSAAPLGQCRRPGLVETWLDHDGGMGHYRLVTGYDDAAGEWTVYNSYVSEGIDPKGPYPGIRIPYDQMDSMWHVFNRLYVVVYDDARAAAVQEILGADQDDAAMWQRALERAQADAQQTPGDAYAWFNLGSSLAAQGRFADAATAFDQARVIGLPWRMLWYQFGPFRAYFEAGRTDELIALADATIATVGNIEETYYWKGKGLQARGDAEGARQTTAARSSSTATTLKRLPRWRSWADNPYAGLQGSGQASLCCALG